MSRTHTKLCVGCDQDFSFKVPDGKVGEMLMRVRHRCDDCSVADREADERERREREAINEAQELKRRLKLSGLPKRLPAELDTDDSAGWHWSREFAAGRCNSLVLTGPVGTGKTTMAAAAVRHRLAKRPGFWRSVPVLITHLGYGFGHPLYEQAAALLDGSYMLGLDDLDKGRPTDYVGQQVFAAIDSCYEHDTPLIVTSNLGLDGIARHWPDHGDAIASRLSEGRVVAVEGADRRLMNNNRRAA